LAELKTGGQTIHARAGAAELNKPDPVPWDAEFRAASTSKTFTAAAVLLLVGDGKLSLDDTVDRWLPGVVSSQGNDGHTITIRQLLGQRSGIFDYVQDADLQQLITGDLQRALHDNTPPEALVAIAMKHAPLFKAGTAWSYSNTNYLLAGMIIEKVTGQDWKELVRARIIAPLGLTHTSLTGAAATLDGPHAHSYMVIPGAPAPIDATDSSLEHTADSAIISTTGDLNTFFQALIGGKLLRPAELAQMQTTQPADDKDFPGGKYGLGIRWYPLSCGGGYWHHEGDSPTGYHTRTGVTADGQRSVVVSVSSTMNFATTGPALLTLVDHALCDTPE
jgi:D-alanyl-D-alanine carboxypeptidase